MGLSNETGKFRNGYKNFNMKYFNMKYILIGLDSQSFIWKTWIKKFYTNGSGSDSDQKCKIGEIFKLNIRPAKSNLIMCANFQSPNRYYDKRRS